MTYFSSIKFEDSPNLDAFGRLRVSNPMTLFDSKQVYTNEPLVWDDAETVGSGTGSVHSANTASSTMSVSAMTIGTRVRQTFMRFNYQPGKSQLTFMTGILDESGGGTGITRRIGLFDDNDGLFFEDTAGVYGVGIRSNATGTPVDTVVIQSAWNLDKMDGTGASGVTLDFSKTQIFVFDFEWLGVGRARFGVVIDGVVIYVHEVNHANTLDVVYMSNPNLPLRYEIINDGTGAASTLEHICATVIAEGGMPERPGMVHSVSTAGTHVDANVIDTVYAVIGMRLRTAHLGAVVSLERLSMLAKTNDDFEWSLIWNPTVAGTFTYADETNTAVQIAYGATANTVTGGQLALAGWGTQDQSVSQLITDTRHLGAAIDGTVDELVLCVRPASSNLDIEASLTWIESR